jgi:hypothetical protein
MNRRIAAALVIVVASSPFALSAHAGPCTKEIGQFEKIVRQSAENPGESPMAPQSIGAHWAINQRQVP